MALLTPNNTDANRWGLASSMMSIRYPYPTAVQQQGGTPIGRNYIHPHKPHVAAAVCSESNNSTRDHPDEIMHYFKGMHPIIETKQTKSLASRT